MSQAFAHIVDDDEAIRDALTWLFRTRQVASQPWESAEAFLAAWQPDWRGCIVLDIRMREMSGLECFDALRERGNTLPVIFLTGHGDVPMAVGALKKGAFDFLEKPVDDNALVDRVIRALASDARRQASEAKGLKRGIGYSSYIEACGLAPSNIAGALGARAGLFEAGEVRVHPTGSVTVFTGSHSHGQGHETTFAQLVAARLGIDPSQVDIVHGDTGRVPFGMGTYGSRSLSVGGTAIMKALDKIEAKAKKIAAHLMEASDADIEFSGGEFKVKGTDKKIPFAQVALTAYVPHNYPLDKLEPGLNETAFYDPTNFTFPAGTYICEVEVDPATGVVRVDRFSAVDDFGVIINPMIVEGQVHGGLVQGIGQALMEHGVYDPESGQLLTGSYMDYTMPRAGDFPEFKLGHVCTPCTHNPIGSKGCGEAGAIGSPPAVINAVLDALKPLGVKDLDMPATPHRVWQAIQNAQA